MQLWRAKQPEMKTMRLAALPAALLLIIAAAGPSISADAPSAKPFSSKAEADAFFEAHDVNGDDVLTAAEIKGTVVDTEDFSEADTSRDGQVSKGEFLMAQAWCC